ncbi:MAG: hypothetical protein COB02_00780 [Candidatus Cloacimonadota bacterium]|nr:MAG: hypothetical protein COB02_00780 [Candidatus Cloacimonadota bacterium]
MKILEFIESDQEINSPAIYLQGTCPFQKELMESFFFKKLKQRHPKIKINHLHVLDLPFGELIQFVRQIPLFAKPSLIVFENIESLPKSSFQQLIEVIEKSKTLNRYYYMLVPPRFLSDKPKNPVIHSIKIDLNSLIQFILHLMKISDLPVSQYLAKQLAEINLTNPINLFSELEKLRIYSLNDSQYKVSSVIPIFHSKKETSIFNFLDRIGTKKLQRSLLELEEIIASGSLEPLPFLAGIKSHFQRLYQLKSLIEPKDLLRIFKKTNQYFTSRSRRDKQKVMEELREYLSESIPEDQQDKFNKKYKSDYYLAKLLFQQKIFSLKELINILLKLTKINAKFQSSSYPKENQLYQMTLEICHDISKPKKVLSRS